MTIQYTAKRSLVGGHVADTVYTLDIDLSDAIRSRNVEKDVIRAASGRTETLWHRSDTQWTLTFAPVKGHQKDLLTEFLDSTASEEEFIAWIYGDEVSPVTLRRDDAGYSWQPFVRTGRQLTDLFVVTITAVEVE